MVNQEEKNAMQIFDFDKTLALTDCRTFEDYADPSFITKARALPAAAIARKAERVMVLTARHGGAELVEAISTWCATQGINARVIGVGRMFPNVRVQGVRKPRKLKTHEKKARIIAALARKTAVTVYDDCEKNIAAATVIENVTAIKV
jgi:ribosomal protein S2